VARTRYEYDVEALKAKSEYVAAPLVVPICANEEHPAPLQRSTLYPVTPMLSVEAVQINPICEVDEAVATKARGAVGAIVSGVVTLLTLE
jgi:hypothetical protein